MNKNILQQQVTPVKPKVLGNERVYVYVPTADNSTKGIASFNDRDFRALSGHITLRWPMQMIVEQLADPTVRPSLTKVLPDEFIKTEQNVTVVNPNTGVTYESTNAEIKLNRLNRNAFSRPELVMLHSDDFQEDALENGHVRYRIKLNNPFTKPSLVQLDTHDFKNSNGVIQVNWPMAHDVSGSTNTNTFGLVKVNPGLSSNLKFDDENYLEVDLDAIKTNLDKFLAVKPTYTVEDPDYVDSTTGLAKRNLDGTVLLKITKDAVGLGNLENKNFTERTYTEFSNQIKTHLESQFNSKLPRALWDGANGLFRDWLPPTVSKNTVQKWFMALEEEDQSLWASLTSMNLYLGIFETEAALVGHYPATEDLLGSSAQVVDTGTFWAVREVAGEYEWYDTNINVPAFYDYLETDATKLKPNGVPSVGTSGKWVASDHVHPSDNIKLDADVIDTMEITVTSDDPTANDFKAKLATVIVLDQDNEPIEAYVVKNEDYLSGIENPEEGDLAISRVDFKIYEFDGTDWTDTETAGSIAYNAQSVINIPFVRTSKHLHNWNGNLSGFEQNENTNETYWAGTLEEFEELDPNEIPNNTLFVVEGPEHNIPGTFATEEQLDEAGLKPTTMDYINTDRFVVIDKDENFEGQLVTIVNEAAVEGVSGPRRRVEAYNFGSVRTTPAPMIVAVSNGDFLELKRRRFEENQLLKSDDNGDIVEAGLFAYNIALVGDSTTPEELELGQLVISKGSKVIESFTTGIVPNVPMVSKGDGTPKMLNLGADKLVTTDANGGLVADIVKSNVIKSSIGTSGVTLESGRVVISGSNNTVAAWSNTAPEGALVVKSDAFGGIKTRTHVAANRVIITDVDGKISELPAGAVGQILASNGTDAPGWIDAPGIVTHLPQTLYTSNPSEAEVVDKQGLIAVILNAPIEVANMRSNCIYYF